MPIKFATAEEEYIKNKDLKKEDVKILQQWVLTQSYLPKISEFQICLFHHSCYYDLEKTKLCIESFYTRRKNNPNMFSDRIPFNEALQLAFKTMAIFPMSKKTPKGYSVIYMTVADSDYRNYNCLTCIQLMDMISLLFLHQEGTSDGYVFVIDMNNVGLGHLLKLNIFLCKTYSDILQDSMPFRLKEFHYINGGGLIDKMLPFLKMVMNKAIFEMIHYHTDIEKFYEFVPKTCLPKDCGGYCDNTKKMSNLSIQNLEDNKDFFIKEEEYINESKKIKKSGWFSFWR